MDELMNKIFTEQTNQVGAWFNQGNKTNREGGKREEWQWVTVEFKWGKEGSGDPRGGRSEKSGIEGGAKKLKVVLRKSLRWKV